MSKILVDTIDTRSGTSNITIGSTNASQITLKSGATLTNFPDNAPSFQAYLGSNSSNLTNGTQTKIQYNTEQWDTDGTYDNSSNYRFTPGVAGKYWCYASAKIDSSGNFPHDAYLSLYKNGSLYKQYQRLDQSSDFSGHLTISSAVDLNTTDYVEVYIVVYDGVNTFVGSAQSSTIFGAYRLAGA